jgi:hypothetical protein
MLWGSKYLEYISKSGLNILQGEHEMNNKIESNKAQKENRTMYQIRIKYNNWGTGNY